MRLNSSDTHTTTAAGALDTTPNETAQPRALGTSRLEDVYGGADPAAEFRRFAAPRRAAAPAPMLRVAGPRETAIEDAGKQAASDMEGIIGPDKLRFAGIVDGKPAFDVNAKLWRVEGRQIVFKGPKGKRRTASKALNDIFDNPDKYALDCGMAMQVQSYRTLQKVWGEKKFDKVFSDLTLSLDGNPSKLEYFSDPKVTSDDEPRRPGDIVTFDNPNVSDAAKAEWSHENAVFVGDGKFVAHPFGERTGAQIVDELNGQTDGKGGANLDPAVLRISPRAFQSLDDMAAGLRDFQRHYRNDPGIIRNPDYIKPSGDLLEPDDPRVRSE